MNAYLRFMEMLSVMEMGRIFERDPFINRRDKLSDIDIDSEYELIQRKESNLSASMRNAVIRRYERGHSL